MSKTALIVDDSKSARVLLKRVLETHALNVDTAVSAEDALDYLIDNRPDVIFMDHLMPGMDGFEAVTAIKKNPETATIPIMMYTSQEGEVYVGQARALGAVGVLPKKVAPVEISNVLKALHIIGEDTPEKTGEQASPDSVAGQEHKEFEILNQKIRTLIHDLFEQQREEIQRDLAGIHDAIATRIADKLRPPPSDEPGEPPLPIERKVSGPVRATLAVLVGCLLILAWLYWQREQSLQELQTQNDELQQTFESRRMSDAETSLQNLQQIENYQRSLDTMYATTISSLEWGANQASEYHFGDQPLDDDRLKVVEWLTDQLLAIKFSGVVRIETHVADFCLTLTGSEDYTLAEDLSVAECDKIGIAPGEAYEIGLGQSPAFASFIQVAGEQLNGRIRYEIVSLGSADPIQAYPVTINGVTAKTWNQIAAANNRVVISLFPESN